MDLERELLNLKKCGWFLSKAKVDEALERETSVTGLSKQKLSNNIGKWVLDQDIKEIGEACLPDDINSGRVAKLEGPIVLQVKKIINVGAPQVSQDSSTAPRMLKLSLTDGKTTCHGVEYQSIPKLSLKIPPGCKIRLNGSISVVHGFLLLTPSNVELLGGEVEHLAEKWRIQQSLVGHTRTAQLTGPPPWVPFGQRLNFKLPDNKTASRGEPVEPEKEREENEEFSVQRHEAIAAAEHSGTRQKAFGGAAKQVEILQPEAHRREPRGRGRGRNRREDREVHSEATRPRDSLNLFEFLQPQIGSEGAEVAAEQAAETREYRPEPQPGQRRGGGRYQRGARGSRGGYQSRPVEPSRAVEKLTEDFAAWPSLEEQPEMTSKPPQQQSYQQRHQQQQQQEQPQKRHQQQQWAPDDYCLARWESSDNFYPAVIQGFTAYGAAVVLFVENGLVRNVDVRNLKPDSADSRTSSIRNDADPRERRGGRGYGPRGGTRVFSRRRNY